MSSSLCGSPFTENTFAPFGATQGAIRLLTARGLYTTRGARCHRLNRCQALCCHASLHDASSNDAWVENLFDDIPFLMVLLLLHYYCITIALLLHYYCITIALLLHYYCITIALLLHYYCITIAWSKQSSMHCTSYAMVSLCSYIVAVPLATHRSGGRA